MMWLKKGANGEPDGGATKPYCYHIDQFEQLRPVVLQGAPVLTRDGPRHHPGGSRGLARTARIELHVRRGAAHLRPADHLSPDLRAGGSRVQFDRLLHDQAVHGRLGVGLPSQPVTVARRRRCREPAGAGPVAGIAGLVPYRKGGENTFMPLPASRSRGRSACTASAGSSSTWRR